MRLTTSRLILDPLTRTDVDAFVGYRRHPDVARFQTWTPDYCRGDAERLLAAQPAGEMPEPGEWLQLAIRESQPNRTGSAVVGDVAIGADAAQPDTYELGVTLHPAAQGRGIALEALSAVRDELFRRGAHRIVMQGDARNAAVIALMRRLDMRHEGSILEGDWFKGEWTTLERYAQLRRERLARD